MKHKHLALLLSASSLLVLTSCSAFDNPFNVDSTFVDTNSKEVFANGENYFQNIVTNTGRETMPSTGNSKIVVVPVVFENDMNLITKTSDAGQKIKSDINTAFFGSSEDTNYWESVSSFYKKSSYDQLNLSGIVGDFVYTTKTSSELQSSISKNDTTVTDVTNSILEAAYTQYFIDGDLNYTDYDSDEDGYIDDFALIYCSPYDSSDQTSLLWAYTFWDQHASSEIHAKTYSWMSYSFMYDGTDDGLDAHTFIHETGHTMGLDDYYSYDATSTSTAREPLGKLDMMDYNILDHNSFSKYCYGWITPTVVDFNETYTIKPFQDGGDSLILANNFNGTCFDEYLIISYYTPTGLNELDATNKYSNYNFTGYDTPGIKVIHVDQRLGAFKQNSTTKNYTWDGVYVNNPSDEPKNDVVYDVISSNTASFCYDSENFALASLVQASGSTDLMSAESTDHTADSSDLFTTKTAQLGVTTFPSFTFNDLTTIPASMTVTSLNSEEATIQFSPRQNTLDQN